MYENMRLVGYIFVVWEWSRGYFPFSSPASGVAKLSSEINLYRKKIQNKISYLVMQAAK
jgi:hypothetical protein